MTVGVIGYGEIGTRVVRAAEGFRLPHSRLPIPTSSSPPTTAMTASSSVALDDLLAEADVVTLHPRVTAETTAHDQCRDASPG